VIEGTFLQWLQRSDWRETYADYKAMCLATLHRVLARSDSDTRLS
jgi:hypothetical protein